MADPHRLSQAARRLLPGCGIAATDPRAPAPPLWPGECAGQGAVPARRAEFAAGRAAARAALAAMGLPLVAIPRRDDRAPHWPPGIAGSITHSTTACLAAVSARHGGLGIDLEPDHPLPDAIAASILTRTEALLRPDAGLVFSAKEAAFKAIYPRIGRILDFDGMVVTLSGDSFTATLTRDLPGLPAGTAIPGRWTRVEGHLLTVVALQPFS